MQQLSLPLHCAASHAAEAECFFIPPGKVNSDGTLPDALLPRLRKLRREPFCSGHFSQSLARHDWLSSKTLRLQSVFYNSYGLNESGKRTCNFPRVILRLRRSDKENHCMGISAHAVCFTRSATTLFSSSMLIFSRARNEEAFVLHLGHPRLSSSSSVKFSFVFGVGRRPLSPHGYKRLSY